MTKQGPRDGSARRARPSQGLEPGRTDLPEDQSTRGATENKTVVRSKTGRRRVVELVSSFFAFFSVSRPHPAQLPSRMRRRLASSHLIISLRVFEARFVTFPGPSFPMTGHSTRCSRLTNAVKQSLHPIPKMHIYHTYIRSLTHWARSHPPTPLSGDSANLGPCSGVFPPNERPVPEISFTAPRTLYPRFVCPAALSLNAIRPIHTPRHHWDSGSRDRCVPARQPSRRRSGPTRAGSASSAIRRRRAAES